MKAGPVGTPELILLLLLFVFGLWWLLSFLPGKVATAAAVMLASFSINPPQAPAPVLKPAKQRIEPAFL